MDVYGRKGAAAALPWIPGGEGAGTVVALGPGVETLSVGDRVGWGGKVPGSYAELVAAPVEALVKLPEGISEEVAAAALLQGMTAHYLAFDTYPIGRDDAVLIHAGAGGVGLLLTQFAKQRGALVVTTVSTEEKARLSREAGADVTVLYSVEDFVPVVRRHTGGRGAQAVYDSVGQATFRQSRQALAPRGYLVLYGQSSGPVTGVDLQELVGGSIFFTRPTLVDYARDPKELQQRAAFVLHAIRDGRLSLRISEVHALADASTAHRRLEERRTTGKVLLSVGPNP